MPRIDWHASLKGVTELYKPSHVIWPLKRFRPRTVGLDTFNGIWLVADSTFPDYS
jgi:hypothetical protein